MLFVNIQPVAALHWSSVQRLASCERFDQVPLAAHVKALRALARLRGQPRVTEAEVEAFYVDVSQVLRVYLEERFGLHAPERTTEEFLGEIEQSDLLNADHRLSITRFLQQCDLVKFARLIPQSEVHDQTFRIANSFEDRAGNL